MPEAQGPFSLTQLCYVLGECQLPSMEPSAMIGYICVRVGRYRGKTPKQSTPHCTGLCGAVFCVLCFFVRFCKDFGKTAQCAFFYFFPGTLKKFFGAADPGGSLHPGAGPVPFFGYAEEGL